MADISIHAPREGGDVGLTRDQIKPALFQSTPPARGATALVGADQIGVLGDFNPRPPRGGRPDDLVNGEKLLTISIHAPREGGDSKDAQFYL